MTMDFSGHNPVYTVLYAKGTYIVFQSVNHTHQVRCEAQKQDGKIGGLECMIHSDQVLFVDV